jgi:hypothetical protein
MAFKFDSISEKKLYQSVITEAIKISGYDCEYWRADRDKTKDKLYSEDSHPNFVTKFPIRCQFDVINEVYMFNKFGFQSPDAMDIYISHQQFKNAMGGDYDPDTVQPTITPRAGDFIWVKYQNRVYIITTVEQENNVFLQEKNTYRLHVTAADVEGGSLTEETSGDESLAIDNWPGLDSLEFDDNRANAEEISGVVVTKTGDSSPFGEWD